MLGGSPFFPEKCGSVFARWIQISERGDSQSRSEEAQRDVGPTLQEVLTSGGLGGSPSSTGNQLHPLQRVTQPPSPFVSSSAKWLIIAGLPHQVVRRRDETGRVLGLD